MNALPRAAVLIGPALVLLACGAAASTPDAGQPDGGQPICEGDGWYVMNWVVDGEAGRTPCVPSYGWGWVSGGRTDGVEPLQYAMGPGVTPESDPSYLARPPLCVMGVVIYNVLLHDGATGTTLAPERPHDSRPAFVVEADMVRGGSELCLVRIPPEGGRVGASATSGTWRVLQGGSWGDVVDVELEGITFNPFDGHTIEVPYARFRVTLPDEPTRYP